MSILRACLNVSALLALVLSHLAWGELPAAENKTAPGEKKAVRTDLYGDPLPPGAIARLGSVRLQYGERVYCLAFSPDGKILASGGGDSIRLWDVATGKLVLEIPTTEWEYRGIRCLAFAPDGKTVAGGTGGRTFFWDTRTGQRIPKEEKGIHANCLAFSPDGKTFATGFAKVVYLWDVATGKRQAMLPGHESAVTHVVFSPDGKVLASGDGYRTVRLWDITTGNELHTLSGHEEGIAGIAFAPDGRTLVSAARHKLVRLWDVKSGKVLRQLTGGKWLMALSPDGQRTIAQNPGGDPFAMHLWDVNAGQERFKLQGHQWRVDRVAFSQDSKLLASTAGYGAIRIWDLTTGKELSRHTGYECGIGSLAYSRDGKTVITSGDGLLRFWNVASARVVREIKGQGEDFTLSRDTRTLAWRSFRDISLWDAVTGKQLGKTPERKECDGAALSPDGTKVAEVLSGLGTVHLWNVANGQLLLTMNGAFGVKDLTFSPDGTVLAVGGSSGTILLWDTTTGKNIRQIVVPKEGRQTPLVYSLAFSQDGKTLIAESDWIDYWDLPSGKHLTRLRQQGGWMVSPDGKIMRVHGPGYKACLLEVASGEVICPLPHTGKYAGRVALAPDGKTLALSNSDNTVLILDLLDLLGVDRNIKSSGLSPEKRQQLWADLAENTAAAAHRAIYTLTLAPQDAVALFQERLKPVPPKDAARIKQLIADLDHDQFATREAASRALRELGRAVEPELLQAMQGKLSREAQRRLEELLEGLYSHPEPPERLRQIRAVRALELIGSPGALRLLESLARGEPSASLTQDARVTLRRMNPERTVP